MIRLFVIFNFYYLRNIYATYMQDYFLIKIMNEFHD